MPRPTKYSSDEERKEALKKSKSKYMLNKEWFCSISDNQINYRLAGKSGHLRTAKHKRNYEKYFSNLKINITI